MSGALAGLLRERVTIRRTPAARDAEGGRGDAEATVTAWAGCVPDGDRRWRVAMRPCDVIAGDRIERVRGTLIVTNVVTDPRMADRITVHAEEQP